MDRWFFVLCLAAVAVLVLLVTATPFTLADLAVLGTAWLVCSLGAVVVHWFLTGAGAEPLERIDP